MIAKTRHLWMKNSKRIKIAMAEKHHPIWLLSSKNSIHPILSKVKLAIKGGPKTQKCLKRKKELTDWMTRHCHRHVSESWQPGKDKHTGRKADGVCKTVCFFLTEIELFGLKSTYKRWQEKLSKMKCIGHSCFPFYPCVLWGMNHCSSV